MEGFELKVKNIRLLLLVAIIPLTAGRAAAQTNGQAQRYDQIRFCKEIHLKSQKQSDGSYLAMIDNGICLFQRRPENALLELRADKAVIFYHQQHIESAFESGSLSETLFPPAASMNFDPTPTPDTADPNADAAAPTTMGVYLEGDVILQVSHYEFVEDIQITAERMYYDFTRRQAVVLDARLSMLLPGRGGQTDATYAAETTAKIPLFVRAEELRTWSFDRFQAEDVQISNDEFHQPQLSLNADTITIYRFAPDGTDDLAVFETDGDRYHIDMKNITLNIHELPIFWWPRATAETTDTEIPLESVQMGYNSEFGGGLETEWDLAWLLGLREPEEIDSTLKLDGFSRRGPAVGIDSDYKTDTMFGKLRTYAVHDQGEDQLGRIPSRDDVPPADYFRGRARWQHRQYLPQDWQATLEFSYLSDRNFLESWREREFDTDKGQETLVYLQKRRANWAFDFLTSTHINDFDYTVTEHPGISLHGAGQDVFGLFSYYHDSTLTRLAEQAGDRLAPDLDTGRETPSPLPDAINQNHFAFITSRHELTLPLRWQNWYITPTLIGNYIHDDSDFDSEGDAYPWQDDPRYLADRSRANFFHGAAGIRLSSRYWHIDNTVQSRLFDLDRMRHVVTPEANLFWQNTTLEQVPRHDIFNFGFRQRWQTKRGPANRKLTTDVLRLNTFATFVTHDVDDAELPGAFLYQQPEWQFHHPEIINHDLAGLGLARRGLYNQALSDHLTADAVWFASPTTILSGKANYNLHDEVFSSISSNLIVQRSELTRYHFGHRYLRDGNPFRPDGELADDRDINFFTAGIHYRLNTKYSLVLNQQFDIERTAAAYTRGTIIRKQRHWYSAVTISYDATRNGTSFVFSIWPAGFEEILNPSGRTTRLAP